MDEPPPGFSVLRVDVFEEIILDLSAAVQRLQRCRDCVVEGLGGLLQISAVDFAIVCCWWADIVAL